MGHRILLKKIEFITHNVLRLVTEKPVNYTYTPGQATEISLDRKGFRDEKRPFTFTSLPEDPELEFTIKVYPAHRGVTEQLVTLKVGDYLKIGDSWGAINYKGPGTFIAGGAGITPFIAILKDLNRKGQIRGNRLFFGNQYEKDIIYRKKLEIWLGKEVINVLSEEEKEGLPNGYVNRKLLETYNIDLSKYVYLCGPPPMMDSLKADLYAMGISEGFLITEDMA
jgi:hypothetical protein